MALLHAARASPRAAAGRRRPGRRRWAAAEHGGEAGRPLAAGRSPGRRCAAPSSTSASSRPGCRPGCASSCASSGRCLRPSGGELAQHLARHGVARADAPARGEAPRPLFDGVGGRAGRAATSSSTSRRRRRRGGAGRRCGSSPDRPPPSSSARRARDSARARCASRRRAPCACARRTWTRSWRCRPRRRARCWSGSSASSCPTIRHPGVRDDLVEPEAARAERPDPAQAQAGGDAVRGRERGPFDLAALHAAVRDGANAVGSAGVRPTCRPRWRSSWRRPGLRHPALAARRPIAANPEAMALLRFAVSDDYDDLAARAWSSGRARVIN